MPGKDSTTQEVVKKYSSPLSGFVKGRVNRYEDAQDVLQDVWYQFSRLTNMHEIENIGAWLYRVARNRITDLYRKKDEVYINDYIYEDEEGETTFSDLLRFETDGDSGNVSDGFWDVLFAALKELPNKQRVVFILNEIDGMTLQEIADMQGENIKTIISRKGYSVRHLRKKMQHLYNNFKTQ